MGEAQAKVAGRPVAKPQVEDWRDRQGNQPGGDVRLDPRPAIGRGGAKDVSLGGHESESSARLDSRQNDGKMMAEWLGSAPRLSAFPTPCISDWRRPAS